MRGPLEAHLVGSAQLHALAATVALLAVVGGAGAAYWFNRDTVNGWVEEKVASFTTPAADKPAESVADDVQSDAAAGGFGIGSLHMDVSVTREAPQPVRGETMVCPCCHRTFERRMRMTTARGSVCPNCYDKWSE